MFVNRMKYEFYLVLIFRVRGVFNNGYYWLALGCPMAMKDECDRVGSVWIFFAALG